MGHFFDIITLMLYHSHTITQTLSALKTSSSGLSSHEVKQRLSQYGKNEMTLQRRPL